MLTVLNFVCYSRLDATFALKLSDDLKKHGIPIWIDKLNISVGQRWDREIEKALQKADCMIVLLSESAIQSENVMDEVSYAIDENKKVIPLKIEACSIPLRLRRIQYVDFAEDYAQGLDQLIGLLKPVDESIEPDEAKNIKSDKPKQKVRSKIFASNFLSQNEIGKIVTSYVDTSEAIKKYLIIYKTQTQQTWLVVTNKQIFCLLDDEETRNNKQTIMWHMPIKEAKKKISAREYKNNSGLFDIGERKNWLYSRRLFPNPEILEQKIIELLS
jgi:hypothetical protein